MTWRLIFDFREELVSGFLLTAALSTISILGSLLPGILLAALMRSNSKYARAVGHFFVALSRNVPSIIYLFIIFYLFPIYFSIGLPPFWTAVAAFVFNGSGYVAEMVRAGLEGVHPGQWEAARALGIRGERLHRRIIVPQAAILVIGPFMNEVTRQVKSSSLASLIGFKDLMYVTASASSATFIPLLFFSVGAVLYFVLIFPISMLAQFLQERAFQTRFR